MLTKVLLGPRGKYSVQTTLDSEAICERKSVGCSVSLTDERWEGGGGGRTGKDISSTWHFWLSPKTVASIRCLKPHIAGFSCTKRVAVVQVYNYTHTPNRRVQPFPDLLHGRVCWALCKAAKRPACLGSPGLLAWEGWGLALSLSPQIGLSALVISVKRGNWGNSTFYKMTTTVGGRKEW